MPIPDFAHERRQEKHISLVSFSHSLPIFPTPHPMLVAGEVWKKNINCGKKSQNETKLPVWYYSKAEAASKWDKWRWRLNLIQLAVTIQGKKLQVLTVYGNPLFEIWDMLKWSIQIISR